MLGVVATDVPIHILDHAVTVVSAKQLQTSLLNALNLQRMRPGHKEDSGALSVRIREFMTWRGHWHDMCCCDYYSMPGKDLLLGHRP